MNKIYYIGIAIFLFLISAGFVSAVNNTNLENYWTFDNNLTENYRNITTTSTGGSIATATNYSVLGGGSLYLDGADDKANWTNTIYDDALPLSINFWVRVPSFVDSEFIEKYAQSGTTGYMHYQYASGADYQAGARNGASTADYNKGSAPYAVNTWTMMTQVIRSTQNCLYINATLIGCTNVALATVNNTAQFHIGNGRGFGYFKGHIDELSIWSEDIVANGKITELYNSGAGARPPLVNTTTTPENITFLSQSPSDITDTTLFTYGYVNFTYNVSIVGLTNAYLNYTITSPTLSCLIATNGTCSVANNTQYLRTGRNDTVSGNFTTYVFNLTENQIYPIRQNYDYTTITDYQNLTMTTNDVFRDEILNISTATTVNIYEAPLLTTSTGIAKIYAYNDSYTGGNPATATGSIELCTFTNTTSYNHTHGVIGHNLCVFSTIPGQRGFLIKRIAGTVTLQTANTTFRTGSGQYSANNGVTYSENNTLLSHVHQFDTNTILSYNGWANYSGSLQNATPQTDTYGLSPLPPGAPTITVPFGETNYTQYMNITYSVAVNITPGTTIGYYLIKLLNNDTSVNATIHNNSLNTSFNWNTYDYNLTIGQTYYIKVEAYDSSGSLSFDIERFSVEKNALLNVTVFLLSLNASATNFTAYLYDYTAGTTQNTTTTTGVAQFDVIQGRTYKGNVTGTGIVSTNQNKTINSNYNTLVFYDFGIVQCNYTGLYNVTTLTLKYYLEDYPTTTHNNSAEITLTTWVEDPGINANTSLSLTSAANHTLCLVNPNASVYANVYIQYYPTDGFTHRYYYYAEPFTSTGTTLNLYNWNTTTDTSILALTVRDLADYTTIEDIVIKLQRYYLGEGVYRTVQMDKTSTFGTAYFNIKERDTDYKLLFYNTNNTLLKESTNTRFSCSSGVCTVEIQIELGEASAIEITTGASATTNTTSIITTYNDDSGDNKNLAYYVLKYYGNNSVTLCNETVSGTAGTFVCNYGSTTGAVYQYIVSDGLIVYGEWIYLNSTGMSDFIGEAEGNFWAAGIVITMASIALYSPVAALIMVTFSLAVIMWLGLVSSIAVTAVGIVALVTIVLIVLIKK